MALYKVDSDTADLTKVAGGTLYADNPIGSIIPYGGSQLPAGWFICDGRSLSKNDYYDLWKVIGYNFGGSDSTFNVPDLREATTKGVGLNGNSTYHYDADGVALGEFIDDRIQGHEHNAYANRTNAVFASAGGTGMDNRTSINTNGIVTDGSNGVPRTGATTEVKAVGVNYIIKVKHTPIPADFIDAVDDAMNSVDFATIVSETANVSIGDHICSKNIKNVCAMIKGHTSGIVLPSTKICSGFFTPLTPSTYAYLDIPFAIRNRNTNVTEMRMGYLDTNGDFYTSAYTENIESDWDIQLFFSYIAD